MITFLILIIISLHCFIIRETVVNMEEGGLTEEEILETLKTHRQIIAHTKTQHWPMHRKLKVSLIHLFGII